MAQMRIPVGVQLYSVREQAAKDLPGVLKEIKKMGYDAVEFAGYHGWSAYDLKKMLDDNGLKCCGTHTGLDLLLGENFEKTVALHKILECSYPIVPGLGEERRSTVMDLGATTKLFNELAEKLKPHGMKTGYHAHGEDFAKVAGGRTQWDILFSSTSSDVVLQMDLGNCIGGGADPLAIMKQFPGRCETVHLKESGGPHGAVIGEGVVDWKGVFEWCPKAGGTKWYVVEHEEKGVDAMSAIARCREGIAKFGL